MTEAKKDLSFEQYKIILDSINQLSIMRESSSNLWITANGIVITAISYIRTFSEITNVNKFSLLVSLLLVGYLFSLTWVKYLNNIRRSINTRYEILLEIENTLPIKFAERVYANLHKREGKWSLTFTEILVPCIFLLVYSIFLLQLLFLRG